MFEFVSHANPRLERSTGVVMAGVPELSRKDLS